MKLTFGKYKNVEICDIAQDDLSYLKWVEENVTWLNSDVRKEINHYIVLNEEERSSIGLIKDANANNTIRFK